MKNLKEIKDKKPYVKPKFEKIRIDNEISLVMATDEDNPPDQGDPPDGGGGGGIWG